MATIKGRISRDKYLTHIKGEKHSLIADEPPEDGGTDQGFSPYDLVCAALASCTAITLRMYADRKEWPLDGVEVDIDFDSDNPEGPVFNRNITLLGALSDEQKKRLLTIANVCPVHKLLVSPTKINTFLR